MKQIFSLFWAGILGLLPLLLLIWILSFIYEIFYSLVLKIFGLSESLAVTIGICVAIFVVILYAGFLVKKNKKSLVSKIFELTIAKIPFVASLYSTLKELVGMFGSNKNNYLGVAEVSVANLKLLGFITKEESEIYWIFIPTTPNPTSGFLIQAKKSDVKILDMPVTQGLKKIISLGIR